MALAVTVRDSWYEYIHNITFFPSSLCFSVLMTEWMMKWMNEWMEWMKGQMNEWNGWKAKWMNALWRKVFGLSNDLYPHAYFFFIYEVTVYAYETGLPEQ